MSLDQELLAQIDKYKEIMQKDPNSREFLTLADLYRKLGVAEEATNILKDGLKKHPDYVDARLAIARIFLTQGQVEDATREFEEVIRQDQTNFVAFKLLGEIAMQKQEHEKAAERFGAAYQLKPDDQECKVMLDYIGSLLGRDVIPQGGGAPAPPPAPAPTPPASGETIAVAPEGEFGEFEAAEEIEDFGDMGEIEEIEESFEEVEDLAGIGDMEEIAEPEGFDEIDNFEEIDEEIEEVETFEETGGIEELGEEIEEVEEFIEEYEEEVEEIEEIEEDFLDTEPSPDIDDIGSEEDVVEEVEELAGGDEELVTQIFQDLSDSQYTSMGEGGMLEEADNDLDDLMGLLDSEESEGLAPDSDLDDSQDQMMEPLEAEDADQDLESMIDLDGVPGMEDSSGSEEIEEIEEIAELEEVEEFAEIEEFEELPEPEETDVFEEIEEIGELEEIEEFEEVEAAELPEEASGEGAAEGEESSIFEDFGIPGEGEPESSDVADGGDGDVFQDFDFDVFEQELLKDHPPQGLADSFEEPEAVEEVEEIAEEEALIEEEFDEGEGEFDEELPDASLAELYIKQDLFAEATSIYRKILQQEPSDKLTKQLLEETLALQAYIEGTE